MTNYNADTVIYGRWVLTMVGQQVLSDHAVVIDQGKITAIVPAAKARQNYHARQTHHCSDHVLMPGLVNSHTHSAMSLLRGVADDLPLLTWLQDYIWPAEAATVSADMVKDGMRLAAAEYIKSGTTCINDQYFFAEQAAAVLHEVGMRGRVGETIFTVATPWAPTPEDGFRRALQAVEAVGNYPLVETSICPHAPYTTSPELLRQVADFAREHKVPVHFHLHETKDELDQHQQNYQQNPVAALEDTTIYDTHLIAVHMTQLTDAEIQLTKDHGVHVVHCPESNMKLASGICPVQKLLDAGINVALGTDGAASNNDLDMLAEMRQAALLGKLASNNPEAVSAHTALEMATINGAKALGFEHSVGSLEPGKAADIIALDMSDYHSQPCYNPSSQVVYTSHGGQVTDVWVQGNQLLRQGALTTIDEAALRERIAYWQDIVTKATNHKNK